MHNLITGFAPIISKDAVLIILGSMPSEASLLKQEYYGHNQNSFWPIMGALFGAGPDIPYEQRKQILIDHGIAVWDVLQSCSRQGSLDANIRPETVKANEFTHLFKHFPGIKHIYFNGSMAETLFRRHCLSACKNPGLTFELLRLPSTSPAHASLTLAEKVSRWQAVKTRAFNLEKPA